MKWGYYLLIIVLSFIAIFPIFLFFGESWTYLYNIILTVCLYLKLPKESRWISILPFLLSSSIPLLEDAKDYFSPKPSISVTIDRIAPETIVGSNTLTDKDLASIGDFSAIILISSKNTPEEEVIVLIKNLTKSNNLFFRFRTPENTSLPYTYAIHLKNNGKSATKTQLSGSLFIEQNKLSCFDETTNLEIVCKDDTNPFSPQVFFESRKTFVEGEQADFRVIAENWSLPIVVCEYDEQVCIQSVFDLFPFGLRYFPFKIIIRGNEISVPDYRGSDTFLFYDWSSNSWKDYFENETEYYLDSGNFSD